ncbi:hypothetical protein BJX68DRAFT_242960 [Aspergillus pseudodeflectus]|uniref:C2H2-type domain-containing protein n=1 Tax=Aspergillus pseudodeflectus TaxID=176178 RepID=A0ABR4JX38_9EURO
MDTNNRMSTTPVLQAVHEWITSSTSTGSVSTILNPNLGYIEAFYQTCLVIFGELWTSHLKKQPRSPRKTAMKNSIAQLRLWIENFEPFCMDTVLEQTGDLKISVVENLCEIGRILLRIQKENVTSPIPQEQKGPRQLLANELEILIEKGTILLSNEGIYSSSSDGSSSDESQPDVSQLNHNFYGRLHSHISCLMDLSPVIERQLNSLQSRSYDPELRLFSSFHLSEVAQPLAMRIRDRFAKAPNSLVERLANANWEGLIRIRRVLDHISTAPDQEDTRSVFKPFSLFHDSGLGTTNPTRSNYAPTMVSHTSFLSTTGDEMKGRPRVPPLPQEGENGRPFQCPYCGKLVSLRNRIQWKMHVFSDLQSYICTQPDCKDALKTFRSRRDWADHEFIHHFSRIQYRCFTCNATRDTEGVFLEHVITTHGITWSEHRLRAALSEAKETICSTDCETYRCELCLQDDLNTRKAYTTHVGQHLEEISLACLPRDDSSEADSDSVNIDNAAASLNFKAGETRPGESSKCEPIAPLEDTSELTPPRPSTAPDNGSHPAEMQSQYGVGQPTQAAPAIPQATPVTRNSSPGAPPISASSSGLSTAQTPVTNEAMRGTPHMGMDITLTPQQQQQFLSQRRELLAQHGISASPLTPQQFAQLQANMRAQQNIQNHQLQVMQQQPPQQLNPRSQEQKSPNPEAYQAHLMRAQVEQMEMARQQQETQRFQNSIPTNAEHQQQMPVAPVQANSNQNQQDLLHPQSTSGMQPRIAATQRYTQLYQQRLLRLRQDMATRLMHQYGPPIQYPPQVAEEYVTGLEQAAKQYVRDIMQRDRAHIAAIQQRQGQQAAHTQTAQQQQDDPI